MGNSITELREFLCVILIELELEIISGKINGGGLGCLGGGGLGGGGLGFIISTGKSVIIFII
jgi:hypothetical protein